MPKRVKEKWVKDEESALKDLKIILNFMIL